MAEVNKTTQFTESVVESDYLTIRPSDTEIVQEANIHYVRDASTKFAISFINDENVGDGAINLWNLLEEWKMTSLHFLLTRELLSLYLLLSLSHSPSRFLSLSRSFFAEHQLYVPILKIIPRNELHKFLTKHVTVGGVTVFLQKWEAWKTGAEKPNDVEPRVISNSSDEAVEHISEQNITLEMIGNDVKEMEMVSTYFTSHGDIKNSPIQRTLVDCIVQFITNRNIKWTKIIIEKLAAQIATAFKEDEVFS